MHKIVFAVILFLPFLPLAAQDKKKEKKERKIKDPETWWTVFGSANVLANDIYIQLNQPAVGYGSGHTFLFIKKDKNPKRVWTGFDFSHHYFGVKKINGLRLFYESFQISFVTRFSFADDNSVVPFIDLSGGLRVFSCFTTDGRRYGGVLLTRLGEMLDRSDILEVNTDIVNEHERWNIAGGISGGVWITGKKKGIGGLSLKGTVNLGTKLKYADYRQVNSEMYMYDYPMVKGSGMFYTFQLAYSQRR